MAREHVVEQGECLGTIASEYGFGDPRLLYDHPANAELKRMRPDPNVLFPGDRVVVPDVVGKTVSARTGSSHVFKVQRAQRVLRLRVLGPDGKGLGGARYSLEFTSASRVEGQTGADGSIEHPVPPGSPEARLEVSGYRMRLRFGYLNPLREAPDGGVSGAQARLQNLGYVVPQVTGTLDDATRVALATFQADNDLPVDGELKEQTISKLEEVHGC